MPTKDEWLDLFFNMVKEVVETITLPTGKQLVPALCFSAIITAVSTLAKVFDLPGSGWVDWRGALLATAILFVLFFIERRGYVEVSRLYRVAKTRVVAAAQRAKGSSPDVEDAGGFNPGDPEPEQDGQ